MGSEEKMTVDERYKYLRVLHRRYEEANRQERGHLLDEAAAITGLEQVSVSFAEQGRADPKEESAATQCGV